MAKNPYLKQHKDFCARLDRERGTMSPEALAAAERLKLSLWAAARNPTPPPTFAEDLAAFMRVGSQAVADQN